MDNYNKGFTLIEILVVISIIGITAALLIPNLSMLFEQNNATQQSHDFISTIQLGLSESETNTSNISICAKQKLNDKCLAYTQATDKETWKNGWLLFTDTNNNGIYDDTVDKLIKVHVNPKSKVVTASPASSLTISQNGNITRGSGNYQFNLSSCSPNSGHRVNLTQSGVVTIEASSCE